MSWPRIASMLNLSRQHSMRVLTSSQRWYTTQPRLRRTPLFRGLLWTTGVAATGTLGYILLQDEDFVVSAEGMDLAVPPLALHPKTGGAKNLPVISHQLDEKSDETGRPRLVILGSGWGAVSLLKTLEKDKYNVTVISENNYFLFTPLLPSATVGTLELRSLVESIRKIAARVHGHFLKGRAVDVDLENKLVEVASNGEHYAVPYDKLVVAVGSTSMTHGVQGLENTVQLKTTQDAMGIRRKILNNVERACLPVTSPEERKRLLSFVVCGGGPTGIEFAAELFDWINEDLVKWFPKLIRQDISISIIQSRDHILNTFDTQISNYAERRFERERINVITNARVERIDEDKVVYRLKQGDPDKQYGEIPYGLCLWSTGIAMTPFAKNITDKLEAQKHQRVLMTDGCLRLKGVDDHSIYALGDCASIENPKLIEHIMEIFEKADSDHDGALSLHEFANAVEHLRTRFPLTERHLGKLVGMFEQYDKDHSGTLDIPEMEAMLKDIDNKMTNLPATAQVASQQGRYLGKHLNQQSEAPKPFRYHHLGTLAYIGNTAVGEFNRGYKMIGGLWALYLWRSVYWSEQVSMRTRLNLSLDWSRHAIFGRDISTV